jgi:hypothetical protein
MDSPGFVRPAGNGPKGETGTTVKKARRGFDTTSIGCGSAPHGGGGSFANWQKGAEYGSMEKIDQIDEDELTSAEYAYYVDTMARIQKKLLEVSQ